MDCRLRIVPVHFQFQNKKCYLGNQQLRQVVNGLPECPLKNAADVMELHLIMMKEKGAEILNPIASKDIWLESNHKIMLI